MKDDNYPKFVQPEYMDEEYVRHCKDGKFQKHIQVDNTWSLLGTGFFVWNDKDSVLGLDPVFVVALLWSTSVPRRGDHYLLYDISIIPTVEYVKKELALLGAYDETLSPIELLQDWQIKLGVGDWIER